MTLKSKTSFRGLSDSGLKTLVSELLNVELPTFGEVVDNRLFDELDPAAPETVRYACADADYTPVPYFQRLV
jgi:DNA polymerase-1